MPLYGDDAPEPCAPLHHGFRADPVTNEPVGDCIYCGASVAWAEQQAEESPSYALFAVSLDDLPGLDPSTGIRLSERDVEDDSPWLAALDKQTNLQALIDAGVPVETFGLPTETGPR